ncbi:MAG: SCO family protein [Gemmataceae bacterium]|nr:SCO family protein [Gemmataceae bacterium]
MIRCATALTLLFLAPVIGSAQMNLRTARREVAFEQRPGAAVPLDVRLRDESGREVRLGDYFGDKPVVLLFAYYRCPGLCSLALNGLADCLRELPPTPGQDFVVLTISFDPGDSAELAAAKRQAYLEQYGRPGADQGWHFLTSAEREVGRLADAVGFRYAYDPQTGEYAHASGLVVLTPEGKVSRYLFGVNYPPRDLRLALVEASEGKIGTAVDQVLLFCLSYDPVTGKYRLAALTAVRAAAVLTVIVLGFVVARSIMRERRRRLRAATSSPLTRSAADERSSSAHV